MTSYQYFPLDSAGGEIRLLTLLPGAFSQRIEIELNITTLQIGHIPKYEALSYCSGSSKNPKTIFVNGDSLSVTESLAMALPYLRVIYRPGVLWIDAICVNQSDLQERSIQVERMVDVYSWVDRVVVWLGQGSKSSVLAF